MLPWRYNHTHLYVYHYSDDLREHLKNAPKRIMEQDQMVDSSSSSSEEDSDSDSSDSSDDDSSDSSEGSDTSGSTDSGMCVYCTFCTCNFNLFKNP